MRLRQWLPPLIVLVAIAAAAALGWHQYQGFTARPLALPAEGLRLDFRPGMSYRDLISELARAGVIERRWPWWLLGRLSPHAARLQAGEYRLSPGLTPAGLIAKLARGEVIQHALTIVEGWRVSELLEAVAAHPALTHTLEGLERAEVRARLDPALDHLEGWFLPETYRFPRGTSDVEFLRRAKRAMEAALDDAWQRRELDLPYASPYEVLIMASIIEKETAQPDERERIAGVFVRRLKRGMRLQTDPTVIYGLGASFDGDLRRRDLRTDTPYNTYTRGGLPPTPIALPSRASLLAAVMPAPGDELYFVGRGDGRHHFSATLDEHNRAVDRYQRSGG